MVLKSFSNDKRFASSAVSDLQELKKGRIKINPKKKIIIFFMFLKIVLVLKLV